MPNIENAIRVEQEYLDYRRDNGESLSALLEPFGYASLDDYFRDKAEFQLRSLNFKIQEHTGTDYIRLFPGLFLQEEKEPVILFPKTDRHNIWHGSDDIDLELCAKLGYDVYSFEYIGGNILNGIEDFGVMVFYPDYIDIRENWFLQHFYDYFKKFFDDVVWSSNDILVNGKKVLGMMGRNQDGWFQFACQVSFKDRSEDIYKICPPTGDKVPGAIPEGYFTRDDLQKEVLSWLR